MIDNRNTTLTKIIFSLRSETLDIKTWQPWRYFDNLCVVCQLKEETIQHFLSCPTYEKTPQENSWRDIKRDNVERQFEIAQIVKERWNIRKRHIEKYEAGQPQDQFGSRAPGHC